MPDTLPEPWTWEKVPPFERAVLSGIASMFDGIKYGARLLVPVQSKDYKYGIEIWERMRFWVSCAQLQVFCNGSQLAVMDRLFNLVEPNSLNSAIGLIALCLGAIIDNDIA